MASQSMPPDCARCQQLVQQASGLYRCHHHNITLHTTINIVCQHFTPYDSQSGAALLQQHPLQPNLLYTWRLTDGQPTAAAMVVSITTYDQWPAKTFWDVLRQVRAGLPPSNV